MNNLDTRYQDLLQTILDYGVDKKDRTGTGTKSIFGYTIRHNMRDGFPLLTTKKMAWKQVVTELLWFLRGDTNIKFLVDNDCHIWNGDAYKNYIEILKSHAEITPVSKEKFIELIKNDEDWAKSYGELGKIYGHGWRNFGGYELDDNTMIIGMDQIDWLIGEIKLNPDSRRLLVSAWQPNLLDQMVLPPCHYGFQVYTRELDQRERCEIAQIDIDFSDKIKNYLDENNIPTRAISLMWNQRSVDTFLGLPFNIASYGLLLEIIAKEVNMVPDQLIGNLGDVHLYSNHIEQAKEQINREPYELPTLKIENEVKWKEGDCLPYYSPSDFTLENYQSHPTIKAPLSN